jgi:hypothetical protein
LSIGSKQDAHDNNHEATTNYITSESLKQKATPRETYMWIERHPALTRELGATQSIFD